MAESNYLIIMYHVGTLLIIVFKLNYVVLIIFYRWKLSGRVYNRKANHGPSLHIFILYYIKPAGSCKNIVAAIDGLHRPPTRRSFVPTHSEKGLSLSSSTGKLHSHRLKVSIISHNVNISYYNTTYYCMTYAPARGHMWSEHLRSRSANRDKNVERNEKTNGRETFETVRRVRGGSGVIENIILGYCAGRTYSAPLQAIRCIFCQTISYNQKKQIQYLLMCRSRINSVLLQWR